MAGSFKIYSLKEDGTRIPAAGAISNNAQETMSIATEEFEEILSQLNAIEAQIAYTAMMTDTLLET